MHLEFSYEYTDMKISKEILFIDKKQHILVKTWEKLTQRETRSVCYIKTLRIYDNHNHMVKEILTE